MSSARVLLCVGGWFFWVGVGLSAAQESPPRKTAVLFELPPVPEAVRTAMIEGRHADALGAIDQAIADSKDESGLLRLVRGKVLAHLGRLEEALETYEGVENLEGAAFARKSRFARAELLRQMRRHEQAEAIWSAEAGRLLSGSRKQELSQIYLELADELSQPQNPSQPASIAPDYLRAAALYAKVLELDAPEAIAARSLHRQADCQIKAQNWTLALEVLQRFVAQYDPDPALSSSATDEMRWTARGMLAECWLQTGDAVQALRAYQDLADRLAGRSDPAARRIAGDSWFAAAQASLGGRDGQKGRGVDFLRRLIQQDPEHRRVAAALFAIAECYEQQGDDESALSTLEQLERRVPPSGLEEADREEYARQVRMGTFRKGMLLNKQARFDPAIQTFSEYVARYPASEQWSAAQQAIVTAKYLKGSRLAEDQDFEGARQVWSQFLDHHPLDPRAAQILFDLAEMHVDEADFLRKEDPAVESTPEQRERFLAAIAQWRKLIAKFPEGEPAFRAQLAIGILYETRLFDLEEAVAAYRACKGGKAQSQARERLEQMLKEHLSLVSERAFHGDESCRIRLSVRNLPSVQVSLYKIDLEAYFRKHLEIHGVEDLDLDLITPDSSFEVAIKDYLPYRPIEQDVEILGEHLSPGPGAFAVAVTSQKLRASALLLRSDLDIIVKSSRREILVFAENRRAQKPFEDVRVLAVATREGGDPSTLVLTTGKDGVARARWDTLVDAGSVMVFASKEGHSACSGLQLAGLNLGRGIEPRGFVYTDRPLYRPGQKVSVRAVVREVDDAGYVFEEGRVFWLEISDSKGRMIHRKDRPLSAFGTLCEEIELDRYAPLGDYSMRCYAEKGSVFTGQFMVQAYELPKAEIHLELPRTVYYRGEVVELTATARWFYGEPIGDAELVCSMPDGTQSSARTDDQGVARFSFSSREQVFGNVLGFLVTLPQEGISSIARVHVAETQFSLSVATAREVYLAGERFEATVRAVGADGMPQAQKLKLRLLERTEVRRKDWNSMAVRTEWAETLVREFQLETAEDTGLASTMIEAPDGGFFVLRALAEDRFGNRVGGERAIFVSGEKDEIRLRFLSDRTRLKVGEKVVVGLMNRAGPGPCLITFEGEEILSYRIVDLAEGLDSIALEVGHEHFPNFAISASAMRGQKFQEATIAMQVERALDIRIVPRQSTLAPGERADVEIFCKDQLGHPVSAELSLAAVDEALLSLAGSMHSIVAFFEAGLQREARLFTTTSCTFRYDGVTHEIATAVIEQQMAEKAKEEWEEDRKDLRQKLAAPDGERALRFGAGKGEGGDKSAADAFVVGVDGVLESLGYLSDEVDGEAGIGGGQGGSYVGRGRRKKDSSDRVRSAFQETAFWSGSIRTDANGRAEISFLLPEQSTRWRLIAIGVTKDTQVGDASASLTARSDFFVELRTPVILCEGDRPQWLARIHNRTTSDLAAALTLKLAFRGEEARTLLENVQVPRDSVQEVVFDAGDPVPLVDSLSAELSAVARSDHLEVGDAVAHTIPVRPYGLELGDARSGVLTSDRTLWLELPKDLKYRKRRVEVFVGSSVQRLLIEEALQSSPVAYRMHSSLPLLTHADTASSLIGVCSVLQMSVERGGVESAEITALRERARSFVGRLVAAQSEDGGWPWIGGACDPFSSGMSVIALGAARRLGLELPESSFERAVRYLQDLSKASAQEANELKAFLSFALASQARGDFAVLNRLHRVRNQLSSAALAFTALALVEMGKAAMAEDLARLLESRKEWLEESGIERGCSWPGRQNDAFHRSNLEMTALALLALQRTLKGSDSIGPGVAFLLGARPWHPSSSIGWVLSALAEYHKKTLPSRAEAKVTVTIDGKAAGDWSFTGDLPGKIASAELAESAPARVRIEIGFSGRGEPHFVAVLRGFSSEVREIKARDLTLQQEYLAPAAMLKGLALPRGFSVLQGSYTPWQNTVSQLVAGNLTEVAVDFWREIPADARPEQLDYLVAEVPIPSGTTVLRETIAGEFDSFEVQDGTLVFFIGARRSSGRLRFSLLGSMPGDDRVLPPVLSSAYDPDVLVVGKAGSLTILERGRSSKDTYRPTPDELLARGQRCFADGERDAAFTALQTFLDEWQEHLEKSTYQDVTAKLLLLSIDRNQASDIVRYFEMMKEKGLDLTIPFHKILVIAQAYQSLREHEQATLVYRAAVEETFGKDLKISGTLEEMEEIARSLEFLDRLLRDFPDLPRVEETELALADQFFESARNLQHPSLKRIGWKRADLELGGMRRLQTFLALKAEHPLAPEAGLSLLSAHFELKDFGTTAELAERLAKRFTIPKLADAFTYTQALAEWSLGKDDRAMDLLRRIADAEYQGDSGRKVPSVNRDLAYYILGQIHHARREVAHAIEWYEKVASSIPDAHEAILNFRERSIKLDEVTEGKPGREVELKIRYRNVRGVELLVYSVDLMTLYLRERNLSSIKDVNLSGITPILRKSLELAPKEELQIEEHSLPLELDKPGAYLVICRGDELFTSGLVLVSQLKLEVREDPVSGRMRVYVLDGESGRSVQGVDIKVIGSGNQDFIAGTTDPRGLFIADRIAGTATVIARLGKDQYAFHRGVTALSPPSAAPVAEQSQQDDVQQSYFKNVLELETQNKARRQEQLRVEIQRAREGVQLQQIEK